MEEVYITSLGVYMPNDSISNDEMEEYLGKINGKDSLTKARILKQNGILQRHYAIDKNQQSTHSNAEMGARAVENALAKSNLLAKDLQLLATGTTQGDLLVPGFASMVHGELDIPACEVANFQSVCASGMMALKSGYTQIKSEEKENAVCVGSELASRLFKSSRFEAQGIDSVPFDTEFLRWMLSDGSGAMVLENKKNSTGISLKIEWIDIKSQAQDFPLCMYAGTATNGDKTPTSWQDFPDYESASKAGAINLKQDIRLLNKVMEVGVAHYFDLIDKGAIKTKEID